MTVTTSHADVATYLNMLFGYVDFEDEHRGCIILRGIGEKGTDKDGKSFGNVPIRGDRPMPEIVDAVFAVIEKWGHLGIGSFIVPAVMDISCLEAGTKCGDDKVRFFTTLLIDLDNGYPGARVKHATAHMGRPSMVVRSGGTTTEGQPKLHVYWRLREPTNTILAIGAARMKLAIKLGGDTSFGRVSQVIRIPGSIYAKNNQQGMCTLEDFTGDEYE